MSWKSFKSWVDGEREAFDFIEQPETKPAKHRSAFAGPSEQARRTLITAVAVLTAAALLFVMLSVVYSIPLYGDGVTTDNEVPLKYIEEGMAEVGAQNLVANIILVYRGFDTFGESTVLFTAATCVIFLLMVGGHGHAKPADKKPYKPRENTVILRSAVCALFPFVLVFGVYILLNGHLSPGGGFSGGAVLGAGLILLDVSLSTRTLGKFFNHTVYTVIKVGALCIYGIIILYLVLCGANGIDNHIGVGIAGQLFSAGVILPINLMVGFEVACTMYAFFTNFYRGELR